MLKVGNSDEDCEERGSGLSISAAAWRRKVIPWSSDVMLDFPGGKVKCDGRVSVSVKEWEREWELLLFECVSIGGEGTPEGMAVASKNLAASIMEGECWVA